MLSNYCVSLASNWASSIDSTTVFYVLSTVAQCVAAFVGFGSGFLILRIQSIEGVYESHSKPILQLPLDLRKIAGLPQEIMRPNLAAAGELYRLINELQVAKRIEPIHGAACTQAVIRLAQYGFVLRRAESRFRSAFMAALAVVILCFATIPFVRISCGYFGWICFGAAGGGFLALLMFARAMFGALSTKPSAKFMRQLTDAIGIERQISTI
jgi:hypothetical protein